MDANLNDMKRRNSGSNCGELAAGSSEPACSEEKHRTMYKDGWKNCWDCGKELITPFNNPNASGEPEKMRKQL